MITDNDPRHGTTAGFQAHVRHGPAPCPACRLAYNKYMARYRKRTGCAMTSGFVPGKRSGLGWPL